MKYDFTRALILLGISVLLTPEEIVLATVDLDVNKLREIAAEPLLQWQEDSKQTLDGEDLALEAVNKIQLGVINDFLREKFPEAVDC